MPIKDSDEIYFRFLVRDEETNVKFDFENKISVKEFRIRKYIRVGNYPWVVFKYHMHDKDFVMVEFISIYYNYKKTFVRRKYIIHEDNIVLTDKFYLKKRRYGYCAFAYVMEEHPLSTKPLSNSIFSEDDDDYDI